jgi:predicted nucleic acid-binding protein
MGIAFNIQNSFTTNISKTIFAVDTNVLYWMFYGNSTYSDAYQKCYQQAVINLKIKKNDLVVSTISLYELFGVIEKNEYNIYKKSHKKEDDFKLKDYRKLIDERCKVKRILDITYKNIKSFVKIQEFNLTNKDVLELSDDFEKHNLDVFDYALVEFCKINNIKNIITDDRDYRTALNDMNIYTANRSYF